MAYAGLEGREWRAIEKLGTAVKSSRRSAGRTKEGGGVTRAKGLGSPGASWNHKLPWGAGDRADRASSCRPLSDKGAEGKFWLCPFSPFLIACPSRTLRESKLKHLHEDLEMQAEWDQLSHHREQGKGTARSNVKANGRTDTWERFNARGCAEC